MIEILNRQAKFNYEILETYEAGIVLTGTEIKSLKNGNANIKDSYANIKNGEIFLLNMHISHYEEGNIFNHEETRTRKLLLHKKEILKLKPVERLISKINNGNPITTEITPGLKISFLKSKLEFSLSLVITHTP